MLLRFTNLAWGLSLGELGEGSRALLGSPQREVGNGIKPPSSDRVPRECTGTARASVQSETPSLQRSSLGARLAEFGLTLAQGRKGPQE